MYIYCLFCATEKCDNIAKTAMELFDCRALSPKQVQHTWSKGKMIDRENDLLPGYVFLYFQDQVENIAVFLYIPAVARDNNAAEPISS